jgi:hypothetical protein
VLKRRSFRSMSQVKYSHFNIFSILHNDVSLAEGIPPPNATCVTSASPTHVDFTSPKSSISYNILSSRMNPRRATARPTVAGQRSTTNNPTTIQQHPVTPASQPAVSVTSPSPGTQTALPTAPSGTQPNGPGPNPAKSVLKWGMDTNVTLNICSLTVGILAVIVSVIFGTAAWIQSGDSHKSLLLAKWQLCLSFPDNPVSVLR